VTSDQLPVTNTIKLIVGLGNPEKKFENTRHNFGFVVLDKLADKNKADWKNWLFEMETTKIADNGITLAKPMKYMNNSGPALKTFTDYYRFEPGELLVVLDDFSLPLGTMRLRATGSSGGHNGLDSIIECLGTKDIHRVRLGIGPVPERMDPADFVLSRFAENEKPVVTDITLKAVKVIEDIIRKGWKKTVDQAPGTTDRGLS
jgi:peptidyl-tRNA hydrolase, PTH1 family